MTLFRQIQLLITSILIVMLAVVLKINFDNTKEFIRNQMYSNAKNTANSMSLSLSPFTGDAAMMETMINAMFDGGYFEEIQLTGMDGKDIYKVSQKPTIEGVPAFFVKLVNLETPAAKAQVSNGWNIAGTLTVKGHPGLSYIQLWDSFKYLCLSFVIIGAIAVAVSHIILKFLLSALVNIRKQAVAIGENEFIVNNKIPRTPELKQVVTAMNQMTTKVQSIYNREIETLKKYQELLYKDQLTGLYNRKYFVNKLNEYIESESSSSDGEIAIISFEGIDNAISEIGHPNMRPFYNAVANYMTENLSLDGCITACFNRQEFAVIMPAASTEQADEKIEKLAAWAKELIASDGKTSSLIGVKIGVTAYKYDENTAKVLSKADYALTVAKSLDHGDISRFNDSSNQMVLGKLEWKNMIETALAENRFVLTSQAVKSPTGDLHQEIFVNLKDENGNIQRAGFFMPMVVNLNLANNLDRYVLEKSTEYLTANDGSSLAINITDVFLNDRASFSWFRQLLLGSKHLKDRMTFEISDNAINNNADICLDFAGLIKGLGFTFGVDRFTMSPKSLENLQKLKPNYIKIDYDYLIGAEDADTALNSLQTITESLGIKLIATKVENQELRNTLESKNIKYFQGRGIAEIRPLDK